MAATLRFNRDDVLRCVKHALASPEHVKGYGETTAAPALRLVKDDGIYLLSNGLPIDLDDRWAGPSDKLFSAYAKGYNPRSDGDIWQKCQDAAGGDDCVETIPLDKELADALLGGADLVIKLNASSMKVLLQTRATIDRDKVAAWLRETLAKPGLVFYASGRHRKLRRAAAHIEARHIRAAHRGATILNDMPFDAALAIYLRKSA